MKLFVNIFLLTLAWNCKKIDNTKPLELKNNLSASHEELKKTDEFNFSVSILEKDQDHRPSSLKIEVIKNSKSSQNIIYKPGTWPVIKDSFTLNRINYFTKDAVINEGVETFHDFITADFNFDGREDFAILYDFGGNGGPSYSYFFQNEKGEFLLNKEFPLNEGPFPKIINKADRTLVIKRPKGCCKTNTTTFQLQNKDWKMISTADEAME